MINFFKRIRQKLLDERNLKKYLIYAIGEIILVMVGILLALQMSWLLCPVSPFNLTVINRQKPTNDFQ